MLLAAVMLVWVAGAWGQPRGDQRRGELQRPDTLRAGDPAPGFKLKTKEGSREVRLSSFKGNRPVILVFGSSRDRPFGTKLVPLSNFTSTTSMRQGSLSSISRKPIRVMAG